jgi:hypothetical protein
MATDYQRSLHNASIHHPEWQKDESVPVFPAGCLHMTNKHTTSLIKILRVLSQRPRPTDTSVVLVEGEATRQLLENTHEG